MARPISTSSSPVANGSSVPACPTFTPRPSRRRIAATTSWDVTPAGLSARRTPSASGRTELREATCARRNSTSSANSRSVENPAARRWPPPPPARAIADTSTRSSVARRRDLAGRRAVGLLSRTSAGDRRALDRAQVVDDALRVALVGAGGREVVARQVGEREQPAVEALDVGQAAREQLELALRDALVQAPVDRVRVDPAGDQLGRHLVRARAGVLVHEAAGVGDQADVQRLGDRRASPRRPSSLHQVPHHLRRARSRRTTWLIVPKRVLSWWWSMLRIGAPPSRLSTSAGVRSMLPQSRKTSVREHRSAGGSVVRPSSSDEAVLVRQRELVGGHERHGVLAQRGQHLLHRRQRADGVAVRALVRGQAEAVGRADGLAAPPGARAMAPFSPISSSLAPRSAPRCAYRARTSRRRRTRASACA